MLPPWVLLIVIAYVRGQTISVNKQVEEVLVKVRAKLRHFEITHAKIPPGMINQNVTFSDGTLVGLDSIQVTDNCTATVGNPTKTTYDLHLGWSLLVLSFGNLSINGEEMSATLRVRNNSVHIKFISYDDDECWTSLQAFDVERFEDVEFGSSRPEFDGAKINENILETVLNILNALFWKKRPDIADIIQGYICGYV